MNLMRVMTSDYSYERTLNQLLAHRGYVFTNTEWHEDILLKKAAHKSKRKSKNKLLEEFDFPLAPDEYLVQKDIDGVIDKIMKSYPEYSLPFAITANTKMLAELLELNEVETLILQFAIHVYNPPYPWENILGTIGHTGKFDDPVYFYSMMFGIEESEVEKAMEGFLFNSGLLIQSKRVKTLHTITNELAETFLDSNISSESISSKLFPSCLESDLTTDNYPHIKNEIVRASAIIEKSLENATKGINVMFYGLPGTGKTELAVALAKKYGWDLKVIGDSSKNEMVEKSRAQRLTSLKIAMKLYQNSKNVVLMFDEMEDLFKTDNNAVFSKAFINRIIETTPIPIIWTTNDVWMMGPAVLRRMTYNIHFEVPPRGARKQIWKEYADKEGVTLDDDLIEELAATYDIVPALISNAVKIAKMANLAEKDDVVEIVKSLDCLVNFGEKRRFKTEGMKDTPYDPSWVNSPTDLTKLTDQLISAKPGFSLCLYGAPGTGKTEFGRFLAKKLNRQVLYKRASDLLSMWVGGTEKLIADAFAEAHREEKVLLIDEGDSFLRDRDKARNSWEITQVNEMLAQMESHNYPFILTTNLMKDIDSAALRRFTFKMEFKFLRDDQVSDIYRAYFGSEAPASLKKIDVLTPGDFANVKKRADIISEVDPVSLAAMLVEECELKPQFKKTTIGF